ncbi:MAG: site-specific integrase [Clostridia bacterium]|nr:site-specific integrase [Clostridia bacterium]
MTQEEILNIITQLREVDASDDLIATVLAAATNTITVDTITSLIDNKPKGNKRTAKRRSRGRPSESGKTFKIPNEEINKMPKMYHKVFACQDRLVPYRFHKGVYEAHYRRHGLDVFACAKDFEEMKRKFYEKLNIAIACGEMPIPVTQTTMAATVAPAIITIPAENEKPDPMFMDYVNEWLKIKERTVKPSTYKEYERMSRYHFEKTFGNMKVSQMTRTVLQDYLFGIIDDGHSRTAEKVHLALTCIFDLISEDTGLPSPMKKIVLPYYESKKSVPFSKDEEKKLVDFCIANPDNAASSALLVLLYFGLRRSELCTIRIEGEWLTCVTSKTKLGRNEVTRKIPFSPVFKRVLPYVDFDKARTTNVNTINTVIKRLFPEHHTHELRHTYITRAKEAGVNQEVVMLWAGHSFDKDVVTSAVDRGYTHYSDEYMMQEAQKVDYSL